MAKYVFLYGGGADGRATDAERAAQTQKWMAWFGTLGSAVVDGGNLVRRTEVRFIARRRRRGPRMWAATRSSRPGAWTLRPSSLRAARCSRAGGRVDVLETIDIM